MLRLGRLAIVVLLAASLLAVPAWATVTHGANMWMWGSNERGQLGLGQMGTSWSDSVNQKVSTPTEGDTFWPGWIGKNVTKVMTAHYDGEWAIALTSAGLVLSWGDCASGLGQGETGGCVARQNCKAGSTSIKCQAEPQVIAFPPGADPVMVDISSGDDFALALDKTGRVYGWGNAASGVLGNGCCSGSSCPASTCPCQRSANNGEKCWFDSPVNSSALSEVALGSKVRKLRSSSDFVMAMLENGRVFALGKNNNGQLCLGYKGTGTSGQDSYSVAIPKEVVALRDALDIRLGSMHGIALLKDKSVVVWGGGQYGQTAEVGGAALTAPKKIYSEGEARLVGAGKHTSFVVLRTAVLKAFGKNTDGQLGLSNNNAMNCPGSNKCEFAVREISLAYPADKSAADIIDIVGSDAHTVLLLNSGEVYATGNNAFEQLGAGCGTDKCFAFNRVTPLEREKILGIEAGVNWGMAWRAVLDPPTFNPPPGTFAPMDLRVQAPGSGAWVHYTIHTDDGPGEWPPLPSATLGTNGTEKLAAGGVISLADPERVVSVRAMSTCGGCGASHSAFAQARYVIVKRVSNPEFKRAQDFDASGAPGHVCQANLDTLGAPPAHKVGHSCLGVHDGDSCGAGECAYYTGNWQDALMVEITVAQAGAAIFYTTDGSKPAVSAAGSTWKPAGSAKEYTGPFEMAVSGKGQQNTTVRAIGVLTGYAKSHVVAAVYSKNALGEPEAAPAAAGIPMWVWILVAVVGGMIGMGAGVAACLTIRLRRLVHKIHDDEEMHHHNHELTHHHHSHAHAPAITVRVTATQHGPIVDKDGKAVGGDKDGKAVSGSRANAEHHLEWHQVEHKTYMAEGAGILRPINKQQRLGLQVEEEVHSGNLSAKAISKEDLRKFQHFQESQKWKQGAMEAGWDPGKGKHGHHKHGHSHHHHHHHHRHHKHGHSHHHKHAHHAKDGSGAGGTGGQSSDRHHRNSFHAPKHGPERDAHAIKRSQILLGDLHPDDDKALSDDESLSTDAIERFVNLGIPAAPLAPAADGAEFEKPPLKKSTSFDSFRRRDMPAGWDPLSHMGPRDIADDALTFRQKL